MDTLAQVSRQSADAPRLRVLYMIQCTNLGGMEQTSSDQAKLMHELFGVQYRAVSPRPAGPGAHRFASIDPDMEFFEYKGRFNVLGQRAFASRVRELAADVDAIYVTGACVSSLRAAKSTGKPVILAHHFHHGSGWVSRLKWRVFYRLFSRTLDGLIFISPFTENEALRIAPWLRGRTAYARQAIRVATDGSVEIRTSARHRLGLPKDAFIVGNAGWLVQRKRFDVFLEVAARVKRAVPDAYFVICGDGPEAGALKERARELGIADCVRFEGWVENLSDQYRAWNVNLFNSDCDAVGRTVLEAIAHGANVVASVTYGGLAEFFAEGNRGFFFDNHNVVGMADAVIELATNASLSQTQGKEARSHLTATYTEYAAIAPIKAFLVDGWQKARDNELSEALK